MKVLPALKAVIAFALGITAAFWIPISFATAATLTSFLLLIALIPFPIALRTTITYFLLTSAGTVGYTSFENKTIPECQKLYVLCVVEEPPLLREGYYSFQAIALNAGIDSLELEQFDQKIWVRGKSLFRPLLGRHC